MLGAFLGGMAFCGALFAGVAGVVSWRRRMAAGTSGAGRARVSGDGAGAGAASNADAVAGTEAGARRGGGSGMPKTVAVPGEALPPAQVAADLVAKDRASGQGAVAGGPVADAAGRGGAGAAASRGGAGGGAAGGLVVVDAARRAVLRPEDMAPWYDAGHVAAMVAWAPREAVRAA